MPPKHLSRNVLLAVIPWFVPTAVAIVAVPLTVRGLGDDGYGVVALVGAVSGYLALTQAGFGSAIVRFIAMFVSRGEGNAIRECLREVISWFAIAGAVGGVVMWAISPWLVTSVLKVPGDLTVEATAAFRIGALTFAVGALLSPLTLLPSAFLRYDLVAPLQATWSAASLAGPAILVTLGFGLLPVMWFGVALSAVGVLVYGLVAARLVRGVPRQGIPFRQHRRDFVGFVLTEAVNEVWCLLQSQTNKVLVGIAGGTTQVAYFQVPSTVSDRANGLLNSMTRVLLPTVSQLHAEGDRERIVALYERATRLLFLLNASLTGAVVAFSAPLLGQWIGPRYATAGGTVLALLIVAQLVASMSAAGGNVNLALGRPRVNLAFSIINSVVNLATVYWLTMAYGIIGTALSILLASLVMPWFVVYVNRRVLHVGNWTMFRDCYLRTLVVAAATSAVAWFALRPLAANLVLTVALLVATTGVALLIAAAAGVLTPEDRRSIGTMLARMRPSAAIASDGREDRADDD